jgi:hypothetical protein
MEFMVVLNSSMGIKSILNIVEVIGYVSKMILVIGHLMETIRCTRGLARDIAGEMDCYIITVLF